MERPVSAVCHGLASGTSEIQEFSLYDPGFPAHRIVLIDTPGFNNASMDDETVLGLLTHWQSQLVNRESSYSKTSTRLAGIIYLHDITQKRLSRSGQYDKVFKQLCGTDNWALKVVLATTMWDEIPIQMGEARERDLRKEYWKLMLKSGSRVARFDGTRPSARELVIPFVAMSGSETTRELKRQTRRSLTFPLLSSP
ncbi:hypothetical protein H0H87_006755, partial [Tephrocybe sp. NHM501043]